MTRSVSSNSPQRAEQALDRAFEDVAAEAGDCRMRLEAFDVDPVEWLACDLELHALVSSYFDIRYSADALARIAHRSSNPWFERDLESAAVMSYARPFIENRSPSTKWRLSDFGDWPGYSDAATRELHQHLIRLRHNNHAHGASDIRPVTVWRQPDGSPGYSASYRLLTSHDRRAMLDAARDLESRLQHAVEARLAVHAVPEHPVELLRRPNAMRNATPHPWRARYIDADAAARNETRP